MTWQELIFRVSCMGLGYCFFANLVFPVIDKILVMKVFIQMTSHKKQTEQQSRAQSSRK